ncbi:MAG: BolA family transcriptional regulator [Rickettsiales bacterium]|nr:BolA family transcriptional regulator [Rickettsiales bacterium]|tara:strand:- start:12210 stop:12437 length:228 start_codon:yes stop_codon:yes gene_type:complete
MAIDQTNLLRLIKDAFPAAQVKLVDLVGDSDHYQVEIKDKSFAGLTKIAQHRKVHAALGSVLGAELHALSIKTSY